MLKAGVGCWRMLALLLFLTMILHFPVSKKYDCSSPLFLCQWNGDCNITYLTGVLWAWMNWSFWSALTVDAKSFHKSSRFQLENSFVQWMLRLGKCEANLASKYSLVLKQQQIICKFRSLMLNGYTGSDSTTCWNPQDYMCNNTSLIKHQGRCMFCELFFLCTFCPERQK